ncbi:MAG: heme-binding protein [Gammaproteobacteria bacterium]|jgi:uncharacterized protein GlcG (DUF336 family)|nr:heme-binding protein [Gammaproteobacteria bacterium]MBQ0773563.1 heme-binding protein [Gammaproteobacteria bacterium]
MSSAISFNRQNATIRRAVLSAFLLVSSSLLLSCGGGGNDLFSGCAGGCTTAASLLSTTEVEAVVARAATEAGAQGAAATIAVVDRVGNVLAVYQMAGAATSVTITSPYARNGGLENISFIPATLAAISKAVTGAYLSSEGNAFTTRTAGQIVQEHFNPGEDNQPGGPLFGVQFSQLACSDLVNAFGNGSWGPKRTPLGLSADPGGMPLYKGGAVVGGIGVVIDSRYSFDATIADIDRSLDEAVAIVGAGRLMPPENRRADRITVDGKLFRFAEPAPMSAGAALPLTSIAGALTSVAGYFDAVGGILGGVAFAQPASGIRFDNENFYPGVNAFVLVDGADTPRYPPTGSAEPLGLSAVEAQTLVAEALSIANASRAQIRMPLGTSARVTVAVVDVNGVTLALARNQDAPVFGTDVALQKARTAAFYSGSDAGAELLALPPANYLGPSLVGGAPVVAATSSIADYVTALRNFLGLPNALSDGAFAFTDRAGGNLSRPYYPDGLQSSVHGPLSKPFSAWSPFSTGLQLDLVYNQVINHVAFAAGLVATDVATGCSGISRATAGTNVDPIANGIQIFPGSVPIYRGNVLVGGIGVSGDGVDQDDMIAFLGLHNAGARLGTINNAPAAMRASQLSALGVKLRYVQCPQTPFLNSDAQSVCHGK